MVKVGRNQPCLCGSGKKFKRCCLPRLEAAAAERAAAARVADLYQLVDDDGLDDASNRVVDLIDANRLDDAEAAAHDLLRRSPEVVDGLERLAAVAKARGDLPRAADYYRKAADFLRDAGDDTAETEAWMRAQADKLAPSTAG
jgi:tetratricopeptide (TPR) repeat protein